jgi:hypothetical protein
VGVRGWMVATLAGAGLLAGAAGTASATARTAGAPAPRPLPTLGVSVGTATPEQSLPTTVTFAGTASAASTLRAVVRPAAAAGCARSFQADRHANPTESVVLADGVAERAGSYSTTLNWTPDARGGEVVCAWLNGGGGAGPVSAPVTVRGPQVPVLTVGFSSAPTASTTFDVDYTVQTDQPLRLLSTIRPAGTSPACGATQAADTAAHPDAHVVFSGGAPVSGGPATTSVSVKYPAGAYLICTWIAGPQPREADAALATPFTVGAKPIAHRALPAHLRITGVMARVGSRLTVRGTATGGLSGRLTLTASCAGSRSRGATSAAGGHFSGHLPLPRLCIAQDRVNVAAFWAGSPEYRRGEAIGRRDVDPAGRRASKPLLFSRIVRVGRRYRDVFRVRPREITVGPVKLEVRWKHWTAREAVATGIAHPVHGRYRVAVRAFRPIRGRFACLTVTRTADARRRTRRYGLGRLGTSTFAWLHARWLHRRASGATPWPRPGCPA